MKTLLFLGIGGPELVIILIPLALVIFCIVDILRSNFKDSTTKLLWVLIVLFAPLIGSLIYLVMGRNQKITA